MIRADVAVVGSGAGGALTAALLAEAGREVVVLEEGPAIAPDSVEPFSIEQMERQYRNAGMTVALGRPPIAYVEACCAGGGTEVNSGLYHRTPAAVLDEWRAEWGLDLDRAELDELAGEIERSLSVQPLPGAASPASRVLAGGADRLGWRAQEVPRWFSYAGGRAERQTMQRTYLARAIAAGARLVTGTRAERLARRRGRVTGVRCPGGLDVAAPHVFVCAGAIQSPALLQRSGLRRGIGATLHVHPTVKAVARFPHELDAAADVPVHQVKPPDEDGGAPVSIGGSASRREQVALALAENWRRDGAAMRDWRRMAVYYAAIRSSGRGRVIALPGVRDPLVTYRLTRGDGERLRGGLARLLHLLLAAGAEAAFPSVAGLPVAYVPGHVGEIARRFRPAAAALMTVHLCSSLPMGAERAGAPVDADGRLRALEGVWVNDASLLPSAPGVNPQGTIMALAARNARRYLARAG